MLLNIKLHCRYDVKSESFVSQPQRISFTGYSCLSIDDWEMQSSVLLSPVLRQNQVWNKSIYVRPGFLVHVGTAWLRAEAAGQSLFVK